MTTAGVNLTFSTGMEENITISPGGGGGGPPPPGYYQEQADNMWTYIPPIIMVWGTVGNGLTIVILLRQLRRLSSTAMYLLTLSVSDLMILWLGPLRQWVRLLWEEDVRKLTSGGCKVQTLLTYGTVQLSSWLLATVTIERLLSMAAPIKVRLICTPTRAGVAISVIITTIIVLNAHYLWGLELHVYIEEYGRYFDCVGKTADYRDFLLDVWPWLDFFAAYLLPFAIILLGNIAIIVILGKRGRLRRKMSHGRQLSSAERENRTITLMLIMLCVVFCTCMTPVSVYYIYLPEVEKKVLAITDPVERLTEMEFYYAYLPAVVNLIAYINASVNFILYVISGSKFRAELMALFTCRNTQPGGVFGTNSRSASHSSSAATRTSYLASDHGTHTPDCKHRLNTETVKDKPDTNTSLVVNGITDVAADKTEVHLV